MNKPRPSSRCRASERTNTFYAVWRITRALGIAASSPRAAARVKTEIRWEIGVGWRGLRNFGRPRFLRIPGGEPGISAVEGRKKGRREKGKARRLMQITTELQAGLHHCSHFIFQRAKGFSVTNVPRFAPLFSRFSLFAVAAASARPLRNM